MISFETLTKDGFSELRKAFDANLTVIHQHQNIIKNLMSKYEILYEVVQAQIQNSGLFTFMDTIQQKQAIEMFLKIEQLNQKYQQEREKTTQLQKAIDTMKQKSQEEEPSLLLDQEEGVGEDPILMQQFQAEIEMLNEKVKQSMAESDKEITMLQESIAQVQEEKEELLKDNKELAAQVFILTQKLKATKEKHTPQDQPKTDPNHESQAPASNESELHKIIEKMNQNNQESISNLQKEIDQSKQQILSLQTQEPTIEPNQTQNKPEEYQVMSSNQIDTYINLQKEYEKVVALLNESHHYIKQNEADKASFFYLIKQQIHQKNNHLLDIFPLLESTSLELDYLKVSQIFKLLCNSYAITKNLLDKNKESLREFSQTFQESLQAFQTEQIRRSTEGESQGIFSRDSIEQGKAESCSFQRLKEAFEERLRQTIKIVQEKTQLKLENKILRLQEQIQSLTQKLISIQKIHKEQSLNISHSLKQAESKQKRHVKMISSKITEVLRHLCSFTTFNTIRLETLEKIKRIDKEWTMEESIGILEELIIKIIEFVKSNKAIQNSQFLSSQRKSQQKRNVLSSAEKNLQRAPILLSQSFSQRNRVLNNQNALSTSLYQDRHITPFKMHQKFQKSYLLKTKAHQRNHLINQVFQKGRDKLRGESAGNRTQTQNMRKPNFQNQIQHAIRNVLALKNQFVPSQKQEPICNDENQPPPASTSKDQPVIKERHLNQIADKIQKKIEEKLMLREISDNSQNLMSCRNASIEQHL